ncbi:hypothetical protein F4778DRAFT_706981 [Xylariomycetidae sp. FL2044]|nr:hypothetical protein F4778DRAFT_706981 [Xylariomycetidae sp. FL2044]
MRHTLSMSLLLAAGLVSQSLQTGFVGTEDVQISQKVESSVIATAQASAVTSASIQSMSRSLQDVTSHTTLATSSGLSASATSSPSMGSSMFSGLSTPPPACAIACQSQAKSTCPPTDLNCICHPDADAQTTLLACVAAECTISEALQAQRFTTELCGLPKTDRRALVLGVIWGFEAFGFIGLALRLASRFMKNGGGLGWDDWLATLILIVNVGAGVTVTIATVSYGYGRDVWMLTADEITQCVMLLIMVSPLYIFSVGCLKVTLILFYLRIFDPQGGNRVFRLVCWTVMGIVLVYTTANTFVSIFNCQPLSYAWTFWDGEHAGRCTGDHAAEVLSHAVLNAVVDVVLFALPIPKLLGLNMRRRKKILTISMFAFGLVTTVCAVARVKKATEGEYGTGGANFTIDTIPFMIWTIAECKLGLMCACVPMAAQALRRIFPRALGSTAGASSGGPSGPKASGSGSSSFSGHARGDGGELGDGGSTRRRGRGLAPDPVSMELRWIDETDTETETGSVGDKKYVHHHEASESPGRLGRGTLPDEEEDYHSVYSTDGIVKHRADGETELSLSLSHNGNAYQCLSAAPPSHQVGGRR